MILNLVAAAIVIVCESRVFNMIDFSMVDLPPAFGPDSNAHFVMFVPPRSISFVTTVS